MTALPGRDWPVTGLAICGVDVTTVSDVLRKSKGKYVILHSYNADWEVL